MSKKAHMAPFRSISLLFTCLCLLFTTACTAKPISDKSALCAGAICDDASFLYCVRNREVWKIDKATYTVSATGLPAMCICYADGALYRLYEETLYRNVLASLEGKDTEGAVTRRTEIAYELRLIAGARERLKEVK